MLASDLRPRRRSPLAISLAAVLLAGGAGSCRHEAGETPPERRRAALDRAIACVQRDDPEGVHRLQELLATGPPPALRAEAHGWIGHAYTMDDDPERALPEYLLALADTPDEPWLHYAAGVAHQRMGALEEALASFTRAIALDPRHVKALQWRAEVRHDLDDDAGALDDLTRALACLEEGDAARIAGWNGDLDALRRWTLEHRAALLDSMGRAGEARADRARIEGR